ncbi:hypothetical protein ACHAWF_011396 [Thalassiosira exigua]
MMPLCEGTREHVKGSLQTWFTDDLGAAGTAELNAEVMAYMAKHDPPRGYHLQCDKSWYVCEGEDEAVARQTFEAKGLEIQLTRGHHYLGGWLGDATGKKPWIEDQVVVLTRAAECLSWIVGQYPQSVYVGLSSASSWRGSTSRM